jgi:Flp pilus assembly protein TadD
MTSTQISIQRDPLLVIQDAYLKYVCEAASARERNEPERSDVWSQAASELLPALGSEDDLIDYLCDHGRQNEAELIARALACLRPDQAGAHFKLGLVLQKMGRHNDAIAPYRKAMSIDPDSYSLRNNLAAALMEASPSSPEAMTLLKASVKAHPDDANAWINLGKVSLNNFDLKLALECDERALQLQPGNPMLLTNHGLRLREAQRWDEAEEFAMRAHQLAPANPSYTSNLAMIQLIRGNYADGWRGHEARWDGTKELAGRRPVFPRPTWQGEPLAGKRLLLWGEQGMGDLLQFCRVKRNLKLIQLQTQTQS